MHGPNYRAQQGQIDIYQQGERISSLFPEKRRYLSGGNVMTEAGIDSGFWGDIYVALGESLGETSSGKQAWAVRLHDKPFVNWIWLGSLLMGLGGILAICDKRYRIRKKAKGQGSLMQEPAV